MTAWQAIRPKMWDFEMRGKQTKKQPELLQKHKMTAEQKEGNQNYTTGRNTAISERKHRADGG